MNNGEEKLHNELNKINLHEDNYSYENLDMPMQLDGSILSYDELIDFFRPKKNNMEKQKVRTRKLDN